MVPGAVVTAIVAQAPFVVSAQPAPRLTYDEIREWAIKLTRFTASDLARAMGVTQEVAERAVLALCEDGICANTGDELDGPYGYEYVVEYVPPPPGPSQHPHGQDPVGFAVAQMRRLPTPERGKPVRIRTRRMLGRSLSTPGARQHHKNREREYERQQAAKDARSLESQRKEREAKEKRAQRTAARKAKAKRNQK